MCLIFPYSTYHLGKTSATVAVVLGVVPFLKACLLSSPPHLDSDFYALSDLFIGLRDPFHYEVDVDGLSGLKSTWYFIDHLSREKMVFIVANISENDITFFLVR